MVPARGGIQLDKLKISVLFWEERLQGTAEHDEVVDEVAGALSEGGHKASLIGINDDLRELLDKLDDQRPDLVGDRGAPGAAGR